MSYPDDLTAEQRELIRKFPANPYRRTPLDPRLPCIEAPSYLKRGGGRDGGRYPRIGRKYLHRWLVELVEGVPLAKGEVVAHICDNTNCIRYDHLARATQSHNIRDAVAKGRHRYGKTRYRLTYEVAQTIRQRAADGEPSTVIAADFGIAPCHVANIIAGRKWKAA